MDVTEYINTKVPFRERVEFTVTDASDGYAEGYLETDPAYSLQEGEFVAAAPVTFSLADAVGSAAVISLIDSLSPLVDMRLDYIRPAKGNIQANAEVIREGVDIAVTDIEVESDGEQVMLARGTYKTGQLSKHSPWSMSISEQ